MDRQSFFKPGGLLTFILLLIVCLSLILWVISPEYRDTLSVILAIILIYRFARLFTPEPIVEDFLDSIQPIAKITEGRVIIQGEIIPIDCLIAPFSKQKCVAFIFNAENVPTSRIDPNVGELDDSIGLYFSELISTPFKIRDETGTVLIDPVGLNLKNVNELITKEGLVYASESLLIPHLEYTVTGYAKKVFGQWTIAQDKVSLNDFTITLKENTKNTTNRSSILSIRRLMSFYLFLYFLFLLVDLIPYKLSNGQLEISYKSSHIYHYFSQNTSIPITFLGSQEYWVIPFSLWGKSEFIADIPLAAFFFYFAYAFFFIFILPWAVEKLMPKLINNILQTHAEALLLGIPFVFCMMFTVPILDQHQPEIHTWATAFLLIISSAIFALLYAYLEKSYKKKSNCC